MIYYNCTLRSNNIVEIKKLVSILHIKYIYINILYFTAIHRVGVTNNANSKSQKYQKGQY